MSTKPNKTSLLKHFQKDPTLFAYHIGDLDDFFFSYCDWPTLKSNDDKIAEALLIYNHPEYSTVMAFGLTDQFPDFLKASLDRFPDKFYCHFQKPHGAIIKEKYAEKPLGDYLKMSLTLFHQHHDNDDPHLIKLTEEDNDRILLFYKTAYPDGYYDPRTLETGHIVGYVKDRQLQAVAGLHVYSKQFNIAVLGSIAVLPEFRGRGLATKITSQLTANLIAENKSVENKLVCLNVKADNDPAISCYKKLGFEITHHYQESAFEKIK